MLSAIAIIPSAPVLVPELAGAAAAETAELRAAMTSAAATLPARWIAVGVGRTDQRLGPDSVGTFAGFGVDLTVQLSPRTMASPADLPVCALIAGWVRAQTHPHAQVHVYVYAHDHDAVGAVEAGRALRAEIDGAGDPIGVLIVADGANTLIPSAPGGHRPEDVEVQRALDDALAGGDVAALTDLPEQVGGRVAFGVLAGLTEPGPRSAEELYRAAPYGVGYFAGVWQP